MWILQRKNTHLVSKIISKIINGTAKSSLSIWANILTNKVPFPRYTVCTSIYNITHCSKIDFTTIISPTAKLHLTKLVVKRKPADINRTWADIKTCKQKCGMQDYVPCRMLITYKVPLSRGLISTNVYLITHCSEIDFTTIIRPTAKLHRTILVVKRKPFDINWTWADIKTWNQRRYVETLNCLHVKPTRGITYTNFSYPV